MTPSAEAALALLIPALFLQDSLRLLASNEAVMMHRRGGWRAGFGARTRRLAGREPRLDNPFLPHEPVFRLRWHVTGEVAAGAARAPLLAELPPELARLGFFAWISWIGLFVVIPTALLGRSAAVPTLAAIALLYANIVASLVATWWWRRPLGLTGKAVAALAFECLACAPYAANLVRRVAAHRPVGEDFLLAAERLLDAGPMRHVKRECLARIDERIDIDAEGDAVLARLRAARLRFVGEGGDGGD